MTRCARALKAIKEAGEQAAAALRGQLLAFSRQTVLGAEDS